MTDVAKIVQVGPTPYLQPMSKATIQALQTLREEDLINQACLAEFQRGVSQAALMRKYGIGRVHLYVVPPQSWGDRSDTKHSKCLLLGGRRLNQLTLIPKPKGSGGARAATAQVGPANNRNDTKRCLPIEASLRPGEAVPW